MENNYLAQKVITDGAFNFDELLAMTPQDFSKKISEKQSGDIVKLEKGGYDQHFVEIQKKGIESASLITNALNTNEAIIQIEKCFHLCKEARVHFSVMVSFANQYYFFTRHFQFYLPFDSCDTTAFDADASGLI